jgi:hypothetical protein
MILTASSKGSHLSQSKARRINVAYCTDVAVPIQLSFSASPPRSNPQSGTGRRSPVPDADHWSLSKAKTASQSCERLF